jgi:crotonobetainyl-CoA:carnitine CoA-transferase CaiB-like acyl-CoA transferase
VDQFVERNAFTAVNFPAGASLTVPATPFRLFATPPIAGGAVAELGAHTGDYQHD